MFELGVKLLLSYLAGSINGSLLLGRLRGVDVREHGSGNAGGTNALRSQGLWFALATVLIDIGKGWLAAAVISQASFGSLAPGVDAATAAALCGAAAVAGHVYPYWFGLRGGKGAATVVGVCAALAPVLLLPVFLVWALSLTLFGFVGFSTMLAGLSIPLFCQWPADLGWLHPTTLFGLSIAAFLVFTHRDNVRRMLAGTEDRKRRVMLFGRARGNS